MAMVSRNILFKPRDIIYYFQKALLQGRQRGGTKLSRRDFQRALREYSEYALQALSSEWNIAIPNTEELLRGFWSGTVDLSSEDMVDLLKFHGVRPSETESAIRFLLDAQFVGLFTDALSYRFATTPIEARSMMRQAGRFIHERGGDRRFHIHKAFHESLALTEQSRRRHG